MPLAEGSSGTPSTSTKEPKSTGRKISFPVFLDWYPTLQRLQRRAGAVVAKNAAASSPIDWAKLLEQLPCGLSEEQVNRRDALFTRCDPNGNGFLSLAEIDKALRDELRIMQIFECKPVIMRAFQAARSSAPASERNHGGDFVSRSTFRVLLFYLKEYFELWQIFMAADTSGDRRIDLEEFRKVFLALQETWGLKVGPRDTAESVFRSIDTNNGGIILFDEFSHWALLQNLSVD
jgi:Ca2+-binding EF-hand superfamily protein